MALHPDDAFSPERMRDSVTYGTGRKPVDPIEGEVDFKIHERQKADQRAASRDWYSAREHDDYVRQSYDAERTAEEQAIDAEAIRSANSFARIARRHRRDHLVAANTGPYEGRESARAKALSQDQKARQFDAMAEELRAVEPAAGPYAGTRSRLLDIAAYGLGHDHTPLKWVTSAVGGYKAADHRVIAEAGLRAERATEPCSRARRALFDGVRSDNPGQSQNELRAMSSSAGSGQVFEAPLYELGDDIVLYNPYPPTFAKAACTQMDLPDYGLTAYTPAITAPGTAAVQSTEGVPPTESDPTSGYIASPIRTIFAYAWASQQLWDRSGPVAFDRIIGSQLQAQIDQQIDLLALQAALAGATQLPARSSFSIPGLLSDIGQAAASLETTAGTALTPDAIVTQPRLGEWILSQCGSDERPVFLPTPGVASRASGFSGYSPAGIAQWHDASVPSSGSDAPLIIASKQATVIHQGQPILDAPPQTGASNLQVLFRARVYVAVVSRYSAGVAVTNGAAYPATPTWS